MTDLKTFTPITISLLIATVVLGTGCAGFKRDWNAAIRNPPGEADLQGRWEGKWLSDATGHSGKLRCVVTKTAPDLYRARFHAKYQKILSFGYTVPLTTERTGNGFTFRGEANLGWWAGGVYSYEGKADATNFFARYSSKHDHGTFQMARPKD